MLFLFVLCSSSISHVISQRIESLRSFRESSGDDAAVAIEDGPLRLDTLVTHTLERGRSLFINDSLLSLSLNVGRAYLSITSPWPMPWQEV